MADLVLNRTLPLDDSWDVIVVGGGPSGCTAATAAAREGARTLLLEGTGALGGMGTSGLVPAWCPFSDQEKMLHRGLAEKVFTEALEGVPHVPKDRLDWVAINAEHLKRVYDDLVTEAGVTVLFHTFLAAVEGTGTVDAIVAGNKSGLTAYRAKVYVDCTGDADLAAWAGAEFEQGEAGTGEVQPATHCFLLTNVDYYAFKTGPRVFPWIPDNPTQKILESGKYPRIRDGHACDAVVGPGVIGFNAGHLWDVVNTDPASVSKAMMEGRKIAKDFRDALAEFHPEAYANSYLVATGSLMGSRESRRVVGDYTLTADDYFSRRSFDDEICRNCYFVDIHTSKEEVDTTDGTVDHVVNRYEHLKPGESHGVPYRCLTPKGLTNVLVAGRSISCDRAVQASVRVMPPCLSTGEAAGLAAYLAAQADDPDVHAVDTDDLRARLRGHGVYLP